MHFRLLLSTVHLLFLNISILNLALYCYCIFQDA